MEQAAEPLKALAISAGVVAIVALAAGAWAFATGAPMSKWLRGAQSRPLPPYLAQLVGRRGVRVVRTFSTPKPGLEGYVLRAPGGANQVLYGEDGYVFAGNVILPNGDSLTARDASRYAPKPDLARAITRLEHDPQLIVEGPAEAPVLYVFFDANCIFCHLFYVAAAPMVNAGRLQVRWVMLGALGPSSVARAAAILTSPRPAAALRANETAFDVESEAGGIAPLGEVPEPIRSAIAVHTAEMRQVGGPGTPTLVYREASGAWAVKQGMPPAGWLSAYARGASPAVANAYSTGSHR